MFNIKFEMFNIKFEMFNIKFEMFNLKFVQDSLNDAWADLLELIDTRNQMLEASRELHKYFHDCKDVLSRILEKQISMSDELGRDGATVSMLQRKHHNFLQDLMSLQVNYRFTFRDIPPEPPLTLILFLKLIYLFQMSKL